MSSSTPGQVFEIYFDTGSDFLWVAGKDCTGCEQFQGRTFDGTKSSTYNNTKAAFPTATYGGGDGKKVDGVYIVETFRLGADANDQLAIANLKFGEATQLTPGSDGGTFSNPASVGISAGSPIVHALKAGQLLDENVFTVFYKFRKGGETESPGGLVTWGGQDTENCGSVIVSAAITADDGFWGPDVDALTVGSRQIAGNDYTTLTDTANSAIRFPPEVYQAVLEEIGGDKGNVDCNTDLTVTLKIAGVDVVLTRKSLVAQNPNSDTCFLNVLEVRYKTNVMKLGLNFFKEFCLVHDFSSDRPKLGFAKTQN